MKIEVEIYDGDTALLGEDAPPKAKNIDDLIKYLATISHRFGNTAVDYSVSWGASALNKRADTNEPAKPFNPHSPDCELRKK